MYVYMSENSLESLQSNLDKATTEKIKAEFDFINWISIKTKENNIIYNKNFTEKKLIKQKIDNK